MNHRSSRFAIALALVGCATGPTGHGGPGSTEVSATLQALPPPGEAGGIRAVAPGETLRSTEQFSVRVEAARPVYVYLLHRGSGSEPDKVLFPTEEGTPKPSLAGQPLFLPSEGQWFSLVRQPGKETFFILASLRPVPLPSVAAEVSKSPAAAPERGDPPPAADEKRRRDTTQYARLDERGTAVLRLWFRQE